MLEWLLAYSALVVGHGLGFFCLTLGVAMYCGRKVGGIWFTRIGRLRVSFCLAKAS